MIMDNNKEYIFAPSVLSANFNDFGNAVKLIKDTGGDWVHLDVMDGLFVPNITFGSKLVSDLRPVTDLILDVHLMTENPGNHIDAFSKAGADYITFHFEAALHIHRIIQDIHNHGKKAGISIVPSTPVHFLLEILSFIDLVLIMTVNPGFGGQSLIPECLEKVKLLNKIRNENNYSYLISVDGGVNRKTVRSVRDAGTDILVSGSAFFGSETPGDEVILFKGNKII